MTFYKQCKLIRKIKSGTEEIVSWIPEKFAKLNKVLKLKKNDDWVGGWIVTNVGSNRIDQSELPNSRKLIRNHRKNTGDSLPK